MRVRPSGERLCRERGPPTSGTTALDKQAKEPIPGDPTNNREPSDALNTSEKLMKGFAA